MNHHFGELGDIWKHLPLAEILRINPPRHYWETHAGSASYPLTESLARRHGVFHFLAHAPADPVLQQSAYLQTLQELPGIYPGSPLLAMRALGRQASYIFCDTDPQSVGSLRDGVAQMRAQVIEADGVSAVGQMARQSNSKPDQIFVLIDPFLPNKRVTPESQTPLELAADLAAAGYRLMFWYAYFEREQRGWARSAIAHLAPGIELWCGDAIMPITFCYPDRSGLFGCGIVLANASLGEIDSCLRLGQALERICRSDVVPANDPTHMTFQVLR